MTTQRIEFTASSILDVIRTAHNNGVKAKPLANNRLLIYVDGVPKSFDADKSKAKIVFEFSKGNCTQIMTGEDDAGEILSEVKIEPEIPKSPWQYMTFDPISPESADMRDYLQESQDLAAEANTLPSDPEGEGKNDFEPYGG